MKSFSPKPACLAATKNENFRKIISCWPTFTHLTRKWFYTLIFTSNHFRREREREERRESQIEEREKREPRSESTNHRLRRSSNDHTAPIVDQRAHRSCLRSISPSPRDLIFSSAARSQFDRIWWIFLLGFVSFAGFFCAISISLTWVCMENWVCKAFSVKMFEWTKHQNWFSVKRILWQPNTWKHFPFRKCFYTNQTQP